MLSDGSTLATAREKLDMFRWSFGRVAPLRAMRLAAVEWVGMVILASLGGGWLDAIMFVDH